MPAVSNTYHQAYRRNLAQVRVFGGTCNLSVYLRGYLSRSGLRICRGLEFGRDIIS